MDSLHKTLLEPLTAIDGVASATIVGSFADGAPPSQISDIDVIVICRKLSQTLFQQCVEQTSRISPAKLGCAGKNIKINTSFGPLKFDDNNTIVIHLMIYDIEGHRHHVLNSPFTCHDWERSSIHIGPSLAEIYPVHKLQTRDFECARRGLNDYMKDLESGVISYRRYEFQSGKANEVLDQQKLDPRHKGEYAFHIIHNLIVNHAKLILQQNVYLTHDQLLDHWKKYLPECTGLIPFYSSLANAKRGKTNSYPDNTIQATQDFIRQFEASFANTWSNAPRFHAVRHAQTDLNDKSFLGQRRDPSISKNIKISPMQTKISAVYTSPLKRAVETARFLAPDARIITDKRLSEIDYGSAEGMTFPELAKCHPGIIEAWQRGEDSPFPGGENTQAVSDRLHAFLNEVTKTPVNTLIVTHNVVLRCLAGIMYNLPLNTWHKLGIPHLEPMELCCWNNRLYPNFSKNMKATLTDSFLHYE